VFDFNFLIHTNRTTVESDFSFLFHYGKEATRPGRFNPTVAGKYSASIRQEAALAPEP
jgi:hypothetical protein